VSGKERKVEVAGELRMKPRIEYGKVASEGRNAMFGLESYVRQCGLEVLLLELVRLRASQINGCAYCVDMHTKDARAEGETEQRLYALVAWEETPFFTERERAALAWTEAVTKVGEGHVADSVFAQARRYFSEKELVDLTLAVVAINGWNRLAISFRTVPGTYSPGQRNVGKAMPMPRYRGKKLDRGCMARSGAAVAAQQSPTAPGFGMSQVLNSDVEQKLSSLPTVNQVRVEIVFDPP
jgi:AhpD family alkylhydroperoxidase